MNMANNIKTIIIIAAAACLLTSCETKSKETLFNECKSYFGEAVLSEVVLDSDKEIKLRLIDNEKGFEYTASSVMDNVYVDGSYFGSVENTSDNFVEQYMHDNFIAEQNNNISSIETQYNVKIDILSDIHGTAKTLKEKSEQDINEPFDVMDMEYIAAIRTADEGETSLDDNNNEASLIDEEAIENEKKAMKSLSDIYKEYDARGFIGNNYSIRGTNGYYIILSDKYMTKEDWNIEFYKYRLYSEITNDIRHKDAKQLKRRIGSADKLQYVSKTTITDTDDYGEQVKYGVYTYSFEGNQWTLTTRMVQIDGYSVYDIQRIK